MNEAEKSSYQQALQKAESELASHEERGEALRRAVEALKGLLALTDAPAPAPAPKKKAPAKRGRPPKKKKVVKRKRKVTTSGAHPPVASTHFRGLGPTAAYRKFVGEFGDNFPVTVIRDALVAGGVSSKSSTSLLTGLHAVRRRDSVKAAAQKKKAKAKAAAAKPAAKAEAAPDKPSADA